MDVYLIDGTYELFRHYYAIPSARDGNDIEIAAARGVVVSVLAMLNAGATHVGVATDHVIESFRNRMWPGYKTGAGIEPDLLAQFALLEDALSALGVAVWPMVEFEADDALASAAAAAALDPRAERVIICTPDKDLAQCVRGSRVVQMNRRTRIIRDEAGIVAKYGVGPRSIPDYLALVGDAADGYPGLRRSRWRDARRRPCGPRLGGRHGASRKRIEPRPPARPGARGPPSLAAGAPSACHR